jgi:retinol dehydrogenase 12
VELTLSDLEFMTRHDQYADCNDSQQWTHRYGQSKIALIHLARDLAARYPSIKTASIHPGRILTGIARRLWKETWLGYLTKPLGPLFCVSVMVGVRNHLWAATGKGLVSGKYYEPIGVPDNETKEARDPEMAKKLWEWTDEQFKELGVVDKGGALT